MTNDEMNPDICPGALEEDGTLDRTTGDSEWGKHKWDDTTDPITCAECGTTQEKPDLQNVKERAQTWLVDELKFSEDCEKANHTDTELAWTYIYDARAIIDDLLKSI